MHRKLVAAAQDLHAELRDSISAGCGRMLAAQVDQQRLSGNSRTARSTCLWSNSSPAMGARAVTWCQPGSGLTSGAVAARAVNTRKKPRPATGVAVSRVRPLTRRDQFGSGMGEPPLKSPAVLVGGATPEQTGLPYLSRRADQIALDAVVDDPVIAAVGIDPDAGTELAQGLVSIPRSTVLSAW